jgi:integrase/recombinase XerD
MSDLHQSVDDYLCLRRALGFTLQRHGRLLPGLVGYLEAAGTTTLTTRLALEWATSLEGHPDEWPIRLAIARGFARYLATFDPATEVPPVDLLPRRRWRPNPHIYTEAEISALVAAAGTLRHPLRRATYETLIGLLATTGMRVGEVIGLGRDDIGQPEGCLTVRRAKFGASRELPLHQTTMDALATYAGVRDEHWPTATSQAFFVSAAGTRLCYTNVRSTFAGLVDVAGIKPRAGCSPPRIHGLRHFFAVAAVTRWYRDGADVAASMPALSAYLGHAAPSGTYWYLTATPELLALAAARLDQDGQRRL